MYGRFFIRKVFHLGYSLPVLDLETEENLALEFSSYVASRCASLRPVKDLQEKSLSFQDAPSSLSNILRGEAKAVKECSNCKHEEHEVCHGFLQAPMQHTEVSHHEKLFENDLIRNESAEYTTIFF